MGQDHDFYMKVKAERLLGSARAHLGDLSTRSVLDVGCGVGLTDGHLVGRFGEVHGVDVSEPMVLQARKNQPNVEYQVCDGNLLPYPDARFDVTFAICVLHHVPPSGFDGFIREMARVTKPGGLLFVFEHNPFNPLTLRTVHRCSMDREAILLRRNKVVGLLRGNTSAILEKPYILFTPAASPFFRTLDHMLGWLPLGAQYYVAARR
jgi:ubiquinone/menaquinone biosynthesis C-methylase UbiE